MFVREGDRISVIHSVRVDEAPEEADDFTELRSGSSSVGMFIDYLKRHPDGVCIPSKLERGVETRMSIGEQTVDRSRMPEMLV